MSYPRYLLCLKGHFYFKIRVPTDLKPHFPYPFIKKSFKTTELNIAKTMLVTMEYQTNRVFTLLRTGMLPDDLAIQLVQELVPSIKQNTVASPKPSVLSAIIEKYIAAKQGEWTEKTKMEVKGMVKLIYDILGAVEITSITRPLVLELRATLQKLPANLYKKHPNKTIQQVLSSKDIDPMSTKSVNKHVSRLGSILKYCVDEGMITSNPALGLKLSENKRADEERDAYSPEDVKMIVSSLPADSSTPERYWIPLIGLYSGMRLNEICQLYVSDIIKFDGLWCFSINGEKDKRVKNDASERVIPIHPTLLNLGLLEYVEQLRANSVPRLWMNLTYCNINGYSNSFGKWYQRFNRHNVTDNNKKVFHSMRHTVANSLKQAGEIETVIAELVGHSNGGSMTMGRYGKRYQPKVLLEALKKLDYGINLKPIAIMYMSGHSH